VVWCLLVWALAWLGARLARALLPAERIVELLLATCLLWAVIASSIVSYLGFFRVLSLPSQLLATGAACLLSALVPSNNRLADANSGAMSVSLSQRSHTLVLLPLLVFSLIACGISALNSIRYVAIDADNMFYHLPFVAEWVRTGSIWPSESIPLIQRAYPGAREAVLTFLATALHNEHLALSGIMERPLFGLTLYALARCVNAGSIPAAAIGAYAATLPIADPSGNDLWLAIMFALALLFLLRARNARGAIVAGLALGSLVSTKYSGVIYGGIILLSYGVVSILRRCGSAREPLRPGLRMVSIVCGSSIFVAWPWYARNVIAFHNPLYPARIALRSAILFDGPLGVESLKAQTAGWDAAPIFQNPGVFFRAFGVLFPILSVAFLCLAGLVLLRRRPISDSLWIVLPPLCAIAYLHQPYSKAPYWDLRYAIPFFVACAGGYAAVLGDSRWALAGAIGLGIPASIINVALWTRYWPHVAVVSVGSVVACRPLWHSSRIASWVPPPRFLGRVAGASGLACLLVFAAVASRMRSELQYSSEYGYRDLESMQGWGPVCSYVHRYLRGQRIVVDGDWRIFPLYGESFENEVLSVKAAGPEEASSSWRATPAEVFSYAISRKATYIVCFRPLVDRPSNGGYGFGESNGLALLKRFPDGLRREFDSRGAYLLAVSSDPSQ
jgi:hypothetical protein